MKNRIVCDSCRSQLQSIRVKVEDGKISAAQALKRPEVKIEGFLNLLPSELQSRLSWEETKAVETAIKYEGYLAQQATEIERLKKAESRTIPEDFEYLEISGLSREVVEKLSRVRPLTLGQAGRIPGVTPAALSILNIYLEMNSHQPQNP